VALFAPLIAVLFRSHWIFFLTPAVLTFGRLAFREVSFRFVNSIEMEPLVAIFAAADAPLN
jgi:hypothetical protein